MKQVNDNRPLTLGNGSWAFWRWSSAMLVARINDETDEVELELVTDEQEQ